MSNSIQMIRQFYYRKWTKLLLSTLVPLMIGAFTVITTLQQNKISALQRDQDKEEARLLRQHQEHQADNLHKENVYAVYLEEVSQLLMSNEEKSSLMQIRVKTLASLRQLDSERKKHLFLFLYDTELIYEPPGKAVSSLLDVTDADFSGISFQGTSETGCSFIYLDLHHAYFSNASFINCYIDFSHFVDSTMHRTNFFKARLLRVFFKYALLDKSNFIQATLFQLSFFGASLLECNFTNAIFSKQQMVDFTTANLTGAIISDEQLSVAIIYNSILPNGTWGPIESKTLVVNGDAEGNVSISFFASYEEETSLRLAFVDNSANNQSVNTLIANYSFRKSNLLS